ncbi:MAG: polysaccharide deacetylase family protein [Clostridia bacterium]|nr:polysaccharide deacetylase family protein [Clostridia bacterium]
MKLLSIILSVCLLLCMLSGCNKKQNDNTTHTSNKKSSSYADTEKVSKDNLTSDTTESGDESGANGGTPPTSTPTVSVPTASSNGDKLVGTIYTRAQLEALSNTKSGHGQGVSTDAANRSVNCINLQNKYGKYDAFFIMPNENKIYLTFDLGYEYNNLTADILDTLKEKNIKAIFFVTKSYCKNKYNDNSHYIRRIIDEGHILANHSVNHKSMPSLTIDQMYDEIMGLHKYIKENFNYEMHLFRPPMGEYSERSLALAQSLGYKSVLWSYAYYDYATDDQPDEGESLNKLVKAAHPGALYLLHAVSQTNANILSDFIDAMKPEYSFEVL